MVGACGHASTTGGAATCERLLRPARAGSTHQGAGPSGMQDRRQRGIAEPHRALRRRAVHTRWTTGRGRSGCGSRSARHNTPRRFSTALGGKGTQTNTIALTWPRWMRMAAGEWGSPARIACCLMSLSRPRPWNVLVGTQEQQQQQPAAPVLKQQWPYSTDLEPPWPAAQPVAAAACPCPPLAAAAGGAKGLCRGGR